MCTTWQCNVLPIVIGQSCGQSCGAVNKVNCIKKSESVSLVVGEVGLVGMIRKSHVEVIQFAARNATVVLVGPTFPLDQRLSFILFKYPGFFDTKQGIVRHVDSLQILLVRRAFHWRLVQLVYLVSGYDLSG